jgi:fused signal recognition particle receptor
MFKFLKEKIENWTKNLTKSTQEVVEEKPKEKKAKEKLVAKQTKKEEKQKKEKEQEETTFIPMPMKILDRSGVKPDLDKLKEIVEDLNPSLDKQLRGQTIGEDLSNEEVTQEFEEIKTKKKGFFEKLGLKPTGKVKISEKDFESYSEDLEMMLLENNVALEVAEKIVKELKQQIVDKEFLKKEIEFEIKTTLGDIIRKILISPPDLIQEIKEKNLNQEKSPYVILFCGINGSGKTTTIAKIAEHLKSKKISCVIAAGDTFRAASIEQIKTHGERLGIKVISHEYGADPASVGFDAIKYAEKNDIDCVLIDTAGRMHTQKNLLREMGKIVKVCNPDKKIFVGESITGNDAVEQVKSFDETIGIDGIVLTKADIDEKGGTALSLGYVTKKPIFYLGTGQEYNKIEPFDKEKFIEKLGL